MTYLTTVDDGTMFMNVNMQREMFIDHLVKHGDITEEHGAKLKRTTLALLTRKGWFGKVWDKVFRKDESPDSLGIVFIRVQPAPATPQEQTSG